MISFTNPNRNLLTCGVMQILVEKWSPKTAHMDSSMAKSSTGFIITFAGCPIAWTFKLQAEVALSITEVNL